MYNVIGLMSGSSLDGIDLVDVNFWHDERWHFEIVAKDNFGYDHAWRKRLSDAFYMSPDELKILDIQYGTLLGEVTKSFIEKYDLKPEIVASHGHTIFHRPQERYTLQIGDGQAIANICGVKTINDFRTEDVLKGGQGAPLVPVGDKFLFSEFPICLNIGGIANVSYDIDGQRIAYDICIANQALNFLARFYKTESDFKKSVSVETKFGETCSGTSLQYDKDGLIARSGNIDFQLLEKINSHFYYSQKFPKSLGREFFEENIKPLFVETRRCTSQDFKFTSQDFNSTSIPDLMATFVEHIAIQIGKAVENQPIGKMLITGGGAKNKFLVERIKANTKHEVVIPDDDIIDYKEALVFAFLGLLRNRNEINVLKSVTGAESDSCSGQVFNFDKINRIF